LGTASTGKQGRTDMPDEARALHVQGRAIAFLGATRANIEHSRLRVAVPEALARSHAG
jgi:hypothetical protein